MLNLVYTLVCKNKMAPVQKKDTRCKKMTPVAKKKSPIAK